MRFQAARLLNLALFTETYRDSLQLGNTMKMEMEERRQENSRERKGVSDRLYDRQDNTRQFNACTMMRDMMI